jgi:predicted dehydrogenase
LIGRKRARALGEHRLVACADTVLRLAEGLASEQPGCLATDDPRRAIEHPEVDAVIVATTNNALASTALAAVEAGKHVLVEKPAARNAAELRPLLGAAERQGVVVKVGFNHRFHPAFLKARQLFDDGAIGELLYVRGRYGHGGRFGYEREWRADPALSGGGELLDQGVHLIDLARWFCGDFAEVAGHVGTFYWQMPVEDNGFALLKTAAGQVAWLHASCTEWKNLFSFEIFGRAGKLQVDGLGGSYGTERLTFYRMLPEMGPPETTAWEYPFEDRSWDAELAHWAAGIEAGQPLPPAPPPAAGEGRREAGSPSPSQGGGGWGVGAGLADALAALTIVERLYEGS